MCCVKTINPIIKLYDDKMRLNYLHLVLHMWGERHFKLLYLVHKIIDVLVFWSLQGLFIQVELKVETERCAEEDCVSMNFISFLVNSHSCRVW